MEWKPVKATGYPQPKAFDDETQRVQITMTLQGTVDHEWEEFLKNLVPGIDTIRHAVDGGTAVFVTHDDQFEEAVQGVNDAIAKANHRFEVEVIPRREAAKQALLQRPENTRRRQEDLERRAAQLGES